MMVTRSVAIVILHAFLQSVVNAQRPVFPLIANGIAPNGARVDGNVVNNDQPAGQLSNSVASKELKQTIFALSADSQFVKTSGNPKICKQHSDCYALREPDEWCLPYAKDVHYDKGCFCDQGRGQCSIERRGPTGSEYTDCTDKGVSKCSTGGGSGVSGGGGGGGGGGAGIQFSDVSNVGDSVNNNLNSRIISFKSKSVEDMRVISSVSPESVYSKTSARIKMCKVHEDCYSMREPDDWCPLPPSDKYYEKGCFCDPWSQRCLIERQTSNGSEYSDCAEKSISKCQSIIDVQYSDVQKVGPDLSKSDERGPQTQRPSNDSGWFTVSSQGRYIPTTGRPKLCIQQQDCYQLREPNEWCPMPSFDRYYEKGCFCDYARNICTIEREIPGGSEYTDCAEKTTSTCVHT